LAGALTALFMLAITAQSQATSLQISPVMVNVPVPGVASKLTLKNSGSAPMKAQIRVFKWIQKNGRDELVATRDVVASPPMAKISPNGTNTVRIVRISKKPSKGEEAYRVIVDQLPNRTKKSGVAVKLQMRYSIPVFFGASASDESQLAWTLKQNGSNLSVINNGNRHARISQLMIRSSGDGQIAAMDGLVGYILSNSTKEFNVRLDRKVKKNSRVLITAREQYGQIKLNTKVQ